MARREQNCDEKGQGEAMNEQEMKRLQLAELHDVWGNAEPTPKEHDIKTLAYESGATHFEMGDITVYMSAKRDFLIVRGSDCGDAQIEGHELDAVIALLQRARDEMRKGGV